MTVLPKPPRPSLHDPIAIALAEDIGPGDLTSKYFVDENRGTAWIIAKEPAVTAGVETAAEVFTRVDPNVSVKILRPSGSTVTQGETVIEVSGTKRSLLTAERVALNFLQRLSGIATLTRRYVDAVPPHHAKILDTRKTTPGLRALEKAAVLAGGGTNHRFGLYDMVMVKDNHLAAGHRVEDLADAIVRFRVMNPGVRVEVEADRLDQVRDFLAIEGIDVILLDNMSCSDMAAAVKLGHSTGSQPDGAGRVQFEASGGVTLDTVAQIAATGVDFISVGALTHSARAIDFSLELVS